MSQDDLPNPESGFVLTHFLVVSDQDRSREFYQSVFGATAVRERDPVISTSSKIRSPGRRRVGTGFHSRPSAETTTAPISGATEPGLPL